MKRKWISTTIRTVMDAHHCVNTYLKDHAEIAAFDTETTGLHIIYDTPFLFQFGWLSTVDPNIGYTYAVDIERTSKLAHDVIKWWHSVAKDCKVYLAHNVKFDMHMLTNIGLPYVEDNLSDTMFYIRMAHDAIPVRAGGAPLPLKEYAARYIHRGAKNHEAQLKKEQGTLASGYNKLLLKRLGAGWTFKRLHATFSDKVRGLDGLPTEARNAYNMWKIMDLPPSVARNIHTIVESDNIPYPLLNREEVIKYAHMDIVWVLEIYESLAPIIVARKTQVGLDIENSIVVPLYEMERVGFTVDVQYIKESKTKLKEYILARRKRFYELTGLDGLKVSQAKVLLSVLQLKYGAEISSTNDEVLSLYRTDCIRTSKPAELVELLEIIKELRTLEKWYVVYLLRFERQLQQGRNKLYTQINQVGAASGRVTSDFQQFPRGGITDTKGETLFTPRRMVIPSGGDYTELVYLDYSQIELRLQAMYTILVGTPDVNLCRAYMPYQCTSAELGEFDYTQSAHLRHAYDYTWTEPDGTVWEPLDVHGATTKLAFDVTEAHPDYKKLRYNGKRVNFAKNYGAKFNRIKQMFPEYSDEQVHKIDDAYYLAFPGIKAYHDYCYDIARVRECAVNLFGVRYYNVSGHNLINMLIQGSGAIFLKRKIRELYDYSKQQGIKSMFQMNIHDELSWEKHKDETIEDVFLKFKEIMESWEDSLVPIVADLEFTTTCWAEKEEYNGRN